MRRSASVAGECRAAVAHAVRAASVGRHVVISIGIHAVERRLAAQPACDNREALAAVDERRHYPVVPGMAPLVYELLDAHSDTAWLAGHLASDEQWAAHLEYLRALQRKGREALARSVAEVSA